MLATLSCCVNVYSWWQRVCDNKVIIINSKKVIKSVKVVHCSGHVVSAIVISVLHIRRSQEMLNRTCLFYSESKEWWCVRQRGYRHCGGGRVRTSNWNYSAASYDGISRPEWRGWVIEQTNVRRATFRFAPTGPDLPLSVAAQSILAWVSCRRVVISCVV